MSNREVIIFFKVMILYVTLFIGIGFRMLEKRMDTSDQETNFVYQQF